MNNVLSSMQMHKSSDDCNKFSKSVSYETLVIGAATTGRECGEALEIEGVITRRTSVRRGYLPEQCTHANKESLFASVTCLLRFPRRAKAILGMTFSTLTLVAVLLAGIVGEARADGEVTIRDSGTCGTNCMWSLDSEGVFTLSGSGSMTNYSSTWAGPDGVAANSPWLNYLSDIKSIKMAEGCTISNISQYAFRGANNLESVDLPSIKTIGNDAFRATSVKDVNLPEATGIGSTAFYQTPNLKSIDLPKVTYLPGGSFELSGLENVTLPSVTSIYGSVFGRDTHLNDIYMPKLQSIGYGVFEYADLKSLTIPDTVTYIATGPYGSHAFIGNDNMQDLTIGASNLQKYLEAKGGFAGEANITCLSGDCMDILTTWDNEHGTQYASNTIISCSEGYLTKGGGCSKPEDCTGEYLISGNQCIKMPGCLNYADGACGGCERGFYKKEGGCVSSEEGCGSGYLEKDSVCISSANGCGAGYKDMGGWCNRIQYTPAEAAPLLNDDNNTVTITFRK